MVASSAPEWNFGVLKEDNVWSELIDTRNPYGGDPQDLYGVCEDMHPTRSDRDPHRVERLLGVSIKSFQRTVSDQVGNAGPEHIRTKTAICKAMVTLLDWVNMKRDDISVSELSTFIQDRFRAIRQEIELQHIRSKFAVKLVEPMIRFAAVQAHEMCEDKEYSAALVMDRKELNKMFLTVKAIYASHREQGCPIDTEAEFTSYLVLVKAGQDMQTAVRDSLAILLRDVPQDVVSSPSVQWALAILAAIHQRNFSRFCKLLRQATYVQACFIHMLFLEDAREAQLTSFPVVWRKNKDQTVTIPIRVLKNSLYVDTLEEIHSWLSSRMTDSFEVQGFGSEASLILPPSIKLQRTQTVSQKILQSRNGKSTREIITSALRGSRSFVSKPPESSYVAPIVHSAPFLTPPATPDTTPLVESVSPPLRKQLEGPDLERAASEHRAVRSAERLKSHEAEGKAAPASTTHSIIFGHTGSQKSSDERENNAEQVWNRTAAEKRLQEAKILEEKRRTDTRLLRAGQRLEKFERVAWLQAEASFTADIISAQRLGKRYRENLARHDTAERASALNAEQQLRDAKTQAMLDACAYKTPEFSRETVAQEARDELEQANTFKQLLLTELASMHLSKRHSKRRFLNEHKATLSHVSGNPAPSNQAASPTSDNPNACRDLVSGNQEQVLARSTVSSSCHDSLIAIEESARFYAGERGRAVSEAYQIPAVSRLVLASRGTK